MSEATSPSQHNKTQSAYNSCPVRRMRNTAVLVKWIEDHQSNPYPTKAEKQLLAYYSGMTLTQLSTWFANARRRIKKIGMKTWLEGRSTFSLDYFPSSANMSRSAMTSSYPDASCCGFSASSSPYTYNSFASGLQNYPATQHSQTPPVGLVQSSSTILTTPSNVIGVGGGSSSGSASSMYSSGTTNMFQQQMNTSPTINGLYGSSPTATQRPSPAAALTTPSMMALAAGMSPFQVSNWSMTSPNPLLQQSAMTSINNASSLPVSRQSGGSSNIAPLHSPPSAYSADHMHHMRSQALDENAYSIQHSPDQILPECASGEPMLQSEAQKPQPS